MNYAIFEGVHLYLQLKEFMSYCHNRLINNDRILDFLTESEELTIDNNTVKRLSSSNFNEVTKYFVVIYKNDFEIKVYVPQKYFGFTDECSYHEVGTVNKGYEGLYLT